MALRDQIPAYWALSVDEVLRRLDASAKGLTQAEAERRVEELGPIALSGPRKTRGFRLLISQFTSPIILILVGATLVALALGDATDSLIILAIVLASGLLGFWQERTAGRAVDALLAQVRVTVRVLRDGTPTDVGVEALAPGDVVLLQPGSVIPADCRVLECNGLLVDESALTGESVAVSKQPEPVAQESALANRRSIVMMGTHVLSGVGNAVVVQVGRNTEFGRLSEHLGEQDVITSFERGTTRFGLLLVRAMIVLVTFVFVVNALMHRPLIDSILFSLALAVGLTPQMLPAIVALSLARGAKRMADEKVIVKRLDAIEDFGAMTTLCTDKTGTITEGAIRLEEAVDSSGHPSQRVLDLAISNATLQRGFPNALDLAIQQYAAEHSQSRASDVSCIDEVPYDFKRKRLSLLLQASDPRDVAAGPGTDQASARTLVTKGALAQVLEVCSEARIDGRLVEFATAKADVDRLYEDLSSRGLRVLGVATRTMVGQNKVSESDETDMVLEGLITFADPVKATAGQAIKELDELGVTVRVVTGDNRLAACHTAQAVGLPAESVMTGEDLEQLGDDELGRALAGVRLFAEVEPLHKERLVRAFRSAGEIVGFLGDGINDAAALHAADIGISVDTAVDVAKQTASIVLLDKSLDAVADGIRLGRETFANTLKYIRVTISANFGNVVSMAVAVAFLPFLPLLPRQILLLNFLSDLPATTISTDTVDSEQTTRPERWDLGGIRNFMISFGLLSSAFDILTFVVLRVGFSAGAALFRSGWFIESTATELAVMLVLRTTRRFYKSRPSTPLLVSSAIVLIVTVAIPYSPLAAPMGLVPLPWPLLLALTALILLYVASNEVMKMRVYRTPLGQSDG